jgi:iron complex transport system substrate-binding protein
MDRDINDISGAVVDCSMKIHQILGPGLFESVYHRVLAYELRKAGFEVESEVPIPLEWDGQVIDESFRADLIVSSRVLIELKSIENLQPVHKKQTLTYLRLADIKLGLLINFGAPLLKEGIHRIANGMP